MSAINPIAAAVAGMPSIGLEISYSIKVTFDNAKKLLYDGHFQDALTLIDGETQKYQSYPVAHTARSLIYRIAATMADESLKQNCFQTAASSIGHAFSLSPSSIYYVFLHASILYEWHSCIPGDFYRDVIIECNRVHLIAQPIDPCDDPLMNDEKMLQLTIPENRIKYCYHLIRFLRDNARNCANVLRESTSLEEILLSPKQLNNQLATLGPIMGCLDHKHDVQEYLETLSMVDWRALNLDKVSISELEVGQHGRLELEALSIAKAGDTTFKRWSCCYCKEQYPVEDYHMKHVMGHVGCLSLELEEALPKKGKIFEQWIRLSKTEGWRPLEGPKEECSLSADALAERTELLERIHHVFDLLVSEGILTNFHVCNLVETTLDEVYTLPSHKQMIQNRVFKSNACIRLMPSQKLKIVLKFLEEIHQIGENNNTEDYYEDCQLQETKMIPLILDLEKKASVLNIPSCGDPQDLVEWLYADWSDGIHKIIWNRMLDKSRKILEKIQVEFSFLCRLCEENKHYSEAFLKLERKKGSNRTELVTIHETLEEAASESQIISELAALNFQICMIEARIMWTQRTINQLKKRIGPASLYDYHIVLSQLAKSFLQKRLEGLAERVAHDKANSVARELEVEVVKKKAADQTKIKE